MTKNYTTETFDKEHIHFGGLITINDFCTEHGQSSGRHINNIISDLIFDEHCRKNAIIRSRKIKEK